MLSIPPIPHNEAFAKEILTMFAADQAMRMKAMTEDWSKWDAEVDKRNTARLKEYLKDNGWPTISVYGQEVAEAAWHLVQHADHDVDFQENMLKKLQALPEGEVEKKYLAMLDDRVAVSRGRPQKYGSQTFGTTDGFQKIYPIEDPENVDKRRAEMGMVPLEENLERIRKEYKLKK